jgi:hypothetical protein
MILDKQNLFSDAQAITADAASTNTIDLGVPGTPVGAAAPLAQDVGLSDIPLLIQVVEAFADLTSLTIKVQTDDNTGFSSAKDVLTVTVPLASLVAGYIAPIDRIPRGTTERYLRLYYDVTGTSPTAGKITAGVVAAVQSND